MEKFNQESFAQVAFAESLHQSIRRLLKAGRAEELLTQKLEEAKKEKDLAGDYLFKNLTPLNPDELRTLKKNYPGDSRFIDTWIKSLSKTGSENGESNK